VDSGGTHRLTREAGADIRTFTAFSHVLALLYGHLSGASSLNEICDALRLHETVVTRIRGTVAPKRNTFSNANRTRDPDIAEKLYWGVFEHLQSVCPSFTLLGTLRIYGIATLPKPLFSGISALNADKTHIWNRL